MKITIKLDKRYRLANGCYSVKLSVARNGKTFYVPLGIEVREEDWDESAKNQNYIKNVKERNALNMFIRSRLSQAEQTVRDLQLKGTLRDFSNKQLIARLSVERTSTEQMQLFSHQATLCLAEKKNKDSVSTFLSAIKALQKFCDYDALTLSHITKHFLEDFRDYLINADYRTSTINNYIARIGIIYNYAHQNGHTPTSFPHIQLKKEETRRRSMLVEQVRKLISCPLSPVQQRYVDIFLLMLYMRGINMKDLCRLRLQDYKDGIIEYNRSKTGKHIVIKVEPEMQEIIERYKGEKALLRFFDGHSEKEEYHKRFGNAMRMVLQRIAEKYDIAQPFSAHWARQTWTSLAVEIGVDIAYVSAGLSHSYGAHITQTYITYRQKKINDESRRVMDYILQKGEYAKKS